MKKIIFIIMIALAVIFIAGCVMDTVSYCPYCGTLGVTRLDDGNYKCGNSECGKVFGAKKL